MRDTAEHHSYVNSAAAVSSRGPDSASSTKRRRIGFTLIEAVVAIAILMIVVAGTFSAVSFAYSASAVAEGLNTAKNIANYTLEFIRSRNVTQQDTHGFTSGLFYAGPPGVTSKELPGIIDLNGEPLKINRFPLSPGDSANSLTYAYSSLQGYVSLRDVTTIPSGEDDPLEPNANVTVGSKRRYEDAVTGDPYIVRFPLDSSLASPSPIRAFTAWGDYRMQNNGKQDPTVWGSDVLAGSHVDDHFTTSSDRKEACTSYRGYRVLTQILARSGSATYKHVQAYDVRVTVLWMVGAKEHRYVIFSTIATY